MPRAFLDNGSSLNVMPMSTLSRLPIDLSDMRKSQMVVRAFDGTKRKVLGNIKLSIQVGPYTFDFEFIVMDINPSYNCFLGRPWIHMAGTVPSTFHQKVKFVVEGKSDNNSCRGRHDIDYDHYHLLPRGQRECHGVCFQIL